jgi:hypothetical protein
MRFRGNTTETGLRKPATNKKKRADGSASLVSETPSRTAAGRLKGLAETYPARVTDRARSVPRTSKKMETTFKHT